MHGDASKDRQVTDFPVTSYTPKIQLSFWTPPGCCPRKVEIERLLNHFCIQLKLVKSFTYVTGQPSYATAQLSYITIQPSYVTAQPSYVTLLKYYGFIF